MSTYGLLIAWEEEGRHCSAPWHSESGIVPPRRVMRADDQMPADTAFRLAAEGTALLWRGDYHNAVQLLQAMARRADRGKPAKPGLHVTFPEAFHRYRLARAQRARILSQLLLPFEPDFRIPLRRAPDVSAACTAAMGPPAGAFVAPLRELQGMIGAWEWQRKGVWVAALDARVHPHYGVFAPVRSEYVDLVGNAPLPATASTVFDIGTGTGVLAAVLARRGISRVIANDSDPRACTCAAENIERLGLRSRVDVVKADLFPYGQADLVVCNPPWLPGKPATPLEGAVYDQDSRMLRGFIAGLRDHLTPEGEGWLILSDLAELLKLRSREWLLDQLGAAGLRVVGRSDIRPRHPQSRDQRDPLHAFRARETTSLWRLRA